MSPQAKPLGGKRPQFDSLVMQISSKPTFFNYFCDQQYPFCVTKNTLVHFQASKCCLEMILCSAFLNREGFAFRMRHLNALPF